MKIIPRLTNQLCLFFRHYAAELLVSCEQLPVDLLCVYHSDAFCKDFVELRVRGKYLSLHMPLQEVLERRDILQQMHPLDLTLIRLAAEQELHHNGDNDEIALWRSGLLGHASLEHFACIEQQFTSPRSYTEMLVVMEPGTDRQICLSVRDLIANRELLFKLKALSTYSYDYLTDGENRQIVVC